MPGTVKIRGIYSTLEQCIKEHNTDGITGRVSKRRAALDATSLSDCGIPDLAESLIWELLGYPRPNDRELMDIDLSIAEQAFRDFLPQMQRKIALAEKEKENAQKTE